MFDQRNVRDRLSFVIQKLGMEVTVAENEIPGKPCAILKYEMPFRMIH